MCRILPSEETTSNFNGSHQQHHNIARMRRRGRSSNTAATSTNNSTYNPSSFGHSVTTASASHQQQHICLISMSSSTSRKDDPVFNVKFVQLVENHPCLWNSTLPAYSKKEEIQKAWQAVANETKDTVRNCRERWRTIRSSFLRSLKLSRTSTGRGKRKYYLSKYLQFLIPYTKTRLKNSSSSGPATATRKVEAAALAMAAAAAVCTTLPPMTRINHMPLPIVSSEDTKDSTNSEIAIAEEDVVVSLHEGTVSHTQAYTQLSQTHTQSQQQQLQQRLMTIKSEQGTEALSPEQRRCATANGGCSSNNAATNSSNNNNNNTNSNNNNFLLDPLPARSSSAVDLTEFAEWIKSKNDHHRHCLMSFSPDADQSFLNSLHPFLKEMSGKQNRRFRQKVIALIDAILDNVD